MHQVGHLLDFHRQQVYFVTDLKTVTLDSIQYDNLQPMVYTNPSIVLMPLDMDIHR